MREIKFRAWDKNEQCWFSQSGDYRYKEYQYLIAIGLHGLPIAVSEDSFKNDEVIGWNRDHNIELMQYTGLLDKQGVEIYEGDIVDNKTYFQAPLIVSFHKGAFGFKIKTILCDADDFVWQTLSEYEYALYDMEVIGNVYEHPELLEV